MEDAIDIYTDQFQLNTGPYGCTINFLLSDPTPPAPGAPPRANRVATVRTSLEHLKTMTFILRRQILLQERQTGVKIEVPIQVLNALNISPEDWQGFWKES